MLTIRNNYFLFNGIIAGGINDNDATITNGNLNMMDIVHCKRQLEELGYNVTLAI